MKTSKIVLGLISEIGGGKGTIAKYLKERYKAKSIRFSDILRDILKRIYLSDSRENMQLLSTILRKSFGQNIFSYAINKDISKFQSKFIVVDGIRREEDISYLKKNPCFYTIAIEANLKTRFERIKLRKENPGDKNKTWKDFKKESQAEAEKEIRKVMKKANFVINNNGSLKETYQQVDKIIKEIRQKKFKKEN